MNFESIPVFCEYINNNEGYDKLIESLSDIIMDNDILIVSETPISTCEGNLVDEDKYNPGILSIIITEVWCKFLWGYILGPLLKINPRSIQNLRKLPIEARKHKEFILEEFGIKYALQPTAEAGVDLSNVPDSLVSLLPENPLKSAYTIKNIIKEKYNKNIEVIIIDTDSTHTFRGKYFTTLPKSVEGIKNSTGIYGYFMKSFSRNEGCTPLASTLKLELNTMINIGNLAEDCQRKHSDNFFETVYNMTQEFDTNVNKVSDQMLQSSTHIPAVIIRNKYL